MPAKNINGQNFKDQITGMADGISAEDIEAATTHRNNQSNPHQVTKAQVGLSNVNNTSDVDKPVSALVQNELDLLVLKDGAKVLSDNNFDNADKTKLDGYSPSMPKDAAQIKLTGYVEPVGFSAIQAGESVQSAIGKLERKLDHTIGSTGDLNVRANWNEVDATDDSYILNKPTTITAQQSQDIINLKTDTHSHGNKSVIDLLTSQDGVLFYDGTAIGVTSEQVEVIDGFVSQSTTSASSAKNATVLKSQVNTLSTEVNSLMSHVNEVGNPHGVNKNHVGLGNVSNTSDQDKPVSIATQSELNAKVDKDGTKVLSDNNLTDILKNKIDSLDNSSGDEILLDNYVKGVSVAGLVPTDTVNVAFGKIENKIDNISVSNSDWSTVDANDDSFILNKPTTITADQAQKILDSTSHSASVTNPHSVTSAQVGLANVDNTSDVNKPVSTAVTLLLSDKVDKETGKGLSDNNFTDGIKHGIDMSSFVKSAGDVATTDSVVEALGKVAKKIEDETTVCNLSIESNTSSLVEIGSSTGDNVSLPIATDTLAGIITAETFTKIESSTINESDSFLVNRTNHTGTQPISSVANLQSELDLKETGLGNPASSAMVLSSSVEGIRSWIIQEEGSTNLSKTVSEVSVTIESSTGTDVVLDRATITAAGLMSKLDKIKLQSVKDIGVPAIDGQVLSSSIGGATSWVDSGDMSKSIYDTNNSGVVDNSEKVNDLTVETAVPDNALFTDTVYTHPVVAGNKHIPIGGASGNILSWSENGTAIWSTPAAQETGMLAATYDTNSSGVVDDAEKVNGKTVLSNVPLNATFTDTVYTHPVTSGSRHIPTGGVSGDTLLWSEDGAVTWGATGSGDMSRAVYDTSNNGVVDNAEKVNNLTVETAVPSGAVFTDTVYTHPVITGSGHIPSGGSTNKVLLWDSDGVAIWGDVSGSGDMVKSTYDTNDSGKVDDAEKVNNHTVESDVPSGAVFTDTVYTHPTAGGSNHVPDGGQSGNILLWDSIGTAVWANLAGTGDMLKSTYDTNDNGTIDNAEKVNNLTVETAVPVNSIFTDTVYTHPVISGEKHIPSGGQAGDTLTWSEDGTAGWTGGVGTGDMNKSTYDTNDNGKADDSDLVNGLAVETAVPSGAIFTDTVYTHSILTGSKHIPAGGSSGNILSWSADGTAIWSSPTGTGDMLQATYDTDGSGIVDDAKRVNNKTVETNVPAGAIFTDTVYSHPSDSHIPSGGTSGQVLSWLSSGVATWTTVEGTGDMLVSTYDTSGTGIVDNAEKVNNKTVDTNVPSGAVFTDTTYSVQDGELSQNNLTNALKISYDSKENELGNPASDGQVVASTVAGVRSWVDLPSGDGATDLSVIHNPTDATIVSSTGMSGTLLPATSTDAGLFLPAEKTKLSDISINATENQSDIFLMDRGNHTSTQDISTVSGLQTALDSKENSLSDPDVDGKVLSSTAAGVRSWIVVGGGSQNGASTSLDTTNFDKGLSAADTNVQVAFETVDEQIGDMDTALASILGREI